MHRRARRRVPREMYLFQKMLNRYLKRRRFDINGNYLDAIANLTPAEFLDLQIQVHPADVRRGDIIAMAYQRRMV